MSATSSDLVRHARQHALGDLPRRTARPFPDNLAILDGDTRLSFAELDAAVDRAAAALADRGLVKGDRLALLSHNCWQFVVLAFTPARAGVVLVPVNFMLRPADVRLLRPRRGHGLRGRRAAHPAPLPLRPAGLLPGPGRVSWPPTLGR